MKTSNEHKSAVFTHIDHIPLVWITPNLQQQAAKLAIWLPYGTGIKKDTLPYIEQLASAGFLAMSFDPWLHSERGIGKTPSRCSQWGISPILSGRSLVNLHWMY